MSFLDRFKRKAQDSPAPDAASDPAKQNQAPAPATQASTPAPASPKRKAADPAIQLAAATVASGYNPDFKRATKEKPTESAKPADDGGEMTLELGDFLRRIPQNLLKPGTPEPKTLLKFNLSELADRIARGQTTIPLHEVYKRVPGIFANEVLANDQTEIRFPWQKVMKLLAEVATATPASGLDAPAAASLAEKLKSRRAVRNIVPGQTATTAAAEAKPKPTRDPAFRSGIEPAPKPAAPKSAAAAPPVPTPPVPPAEDPALAAPTGDDESLSREELLRARDAARLAAARVKGEYERQLATAFQERKAIAEDRERVFAELAKAQKEIEDRADQAEFEKSVAAKSSENLARLQQERDALQRELNARDRERESLKAEMSKLQGGAAPSGPDPRLAELLAERDALAQQKAHLSSQLAELSKRSPAKPAADPIALAAVTAQTQRQIDEFQKRVTALETTQRDTVQELQRERDAKVNLQQQLETAERAKQEAAAQVENVRTTLQREFEAAAAQREVAAARALNEAQQNISILNATKDQLAGELEETRTKLRADAAAAAERLKQELHATASQRETEAAHTLQEAQGKISELNAAKEKLAAELEGTRTRLTAEAAAATERLKHDLQSTASQREADAARSLQEAQGKISELNTAKENLAAELEETRTRLTAEAAAAAERLKHDLQSTASQRETEAARTL
ncbi:MAG: hypothetical protein WCF18_20355, partial [Chthoniobacteraceae bacterium]